MSTTLDPQFLTACLQISAFKGGQMAAAQGALITLALRNGTVMATDIPEAILGGSRHISGAAVGSLVSIGLLVVADRVKSPDVKAKGRRLDVLKIADGKRGAAVAFLSRAGLPVPTADHAAPAQTLLALA